MRAIAFTGHPSPWVKAARDTRPLRTVNGFPSIRPRHSTQLPLQANAESASLCGVAGCGSRRERRLRRMRKPRQCRAKRGALILKRSTKQRDPSRDISAPVSVHPTLVNVRLRFVVLRDVPPVWPSPRRGADPRAAVLTEISALQTPGTRSLGGSAGSHAEPDLARYVALT